MNLSSRRRHREGENLLRHAGDRLRRGYLGGRSLPECATGLTHSLIKSWCGTHPYLIKTGAYCCSLREAFVEWPGTIGGGLSVVKLVRLGRSAASTSREILGINGEWTIFATILKVGSNGLWHHYGKLEIH